MRNRRLSGSSPPRVPSGAAGPAAVGSDVAIAAALLTPWLFRGRPESPTCQAEPGQMDGLRELLPLSSDGETVDMVFCCTDIE